MGHLKRFFAMLLISGLLLSAGTVFADENQAVSQSAAAEPNVSEPSDFLLQDRQTASQRVYGTITWLEDGRIQLNNSNENDPYNDIILSIGDNTLILDAVDGLPVDLSELKDGDTIYAYTAEFMTLSLPPMTTAQLILCNIPQDFNVPGYFEIQTATFSEDGKTVLLTTDRAMHLTITEECQLTPYLTRNIVLPENLIPGTRILAWYDLVLETYPAQTSPSKLVVFPSTYRGYVELSKSGALYVNGLELTGFAAKYENGHVMLPLRAICETAGLTVHWDGTEKSITVIDGETELFRLTIGSDEALVDVDTIWTLSAKVGLDNGSAYIASEELALFTGLFLSAKK